MSTPRPDIAIVDYGMANLRSVQKAFEKVGYSACITGDPNILAEATKIVLPGVGAFQDAIGRIREADLANVLTAHIDQGLPFLGICLGMQMLFTRSHEDGIHAGLDIYPGEVLRFPAEQWLKVPHMGWNNLRLTQPSCPLFEGLPEELYVYFVHSYYVAPMERSLVAAEADYPTPFCAVTWRENVFSTQFHPEKSQSVGLAMLRNFARL
ncbi:MAG: imidazole glycerol phosphate synthase subunit HisH [Fimbriiglobus sp.]